MVIIDATDSIVGRFSTQIAKMALEGQEVHVINCDKALYSGSIKQVLEQFQRRRERTVALKGPYYPKQSDRIVKRSIRGMIPYKASRGREAFDRVKCYAGVPADLEGKDAVQLKNTNKSKLPSVKFVTVKEIAQHLGGRQ